MTEDTKDQVSTALIGKGYVVSKRSFASGDYEGNHVKLDDAEIIFRADDDDPSALIISYYKYLKPESNLKKSLAGMIWFIKFLRCEVASIKSIKGLVSPECDQISSDRLSKLYKLFGATTLEWDLAEEWVSLELEKFRPI